MSDILIKGMEMPKNCVKCPCCAAGFCRIPRGTSEYAEYVFDYGQNERHPNCPLVELPPHGRLIDADKIEYEKLYIDDVGKSYEMVGKDDIDELPTVIEAKRKGARNKNAR